MTKLFNAGALGLALALASTLAITTTANAQTDEAQVSVTVPYGDLNITQADGAQTLLHRISTASVQVCGGEPDVRAPQQRAAFDQCRKDAVHRAVAKVGSPMLTAAVSPDAEPMRVAER